MQVKKLRADAVLPTRGSFYSAGWDLYTTNKEPVTIQPDSCYMFGTGLAFAIPEDYFGAIYIRSSVGIKKHLMLSNNVGVIDSDYRGEVMIQVHNMGETPVTVEPYSRIAQMVVTPCPTMFMEWVEELPDTVRGTGGIGSTGEK